MNVALFLRAKDMTSARDQAFGLLRQVLGSGAAHGYHLAPAREGRPM
ncbi:hypothetical protein [Streptomyces xanthophaeus]|nr:hypothetical protein [Streptomyces xanthophaeus]